MELTKKQMALVSFDIQALSLVLGSSATPLVVSYPIDSVRDMEIVNEEALIQAIDMILTGNKITNLRLVFIISDELVFQKVFPKDEEQMDQAMKKFVDMVPFEIVSSIQIETQAGTTVIAANQGFIDCVRSVFEQHNCVVELVFPRSIFLQELPQNQALSIDSAKRILTRAESLKQYSFLSPKQEELVRNEMPKAIDATSLTLQSKPSSKRTYFLVGVFIFLLVVLVVVYFTAK